MTEQAKRVSFKTVGCRLNQAETARITSSFIDAGYSIVPFGEPCEICVIHTCTVTSRADQDCARLAHVAGRIAPRPVVVLAGCGVEAQVSSPFWSALARLPSVALAKVGQRFPEDPKSGVPSTSEDSAEARKPPHSKTCSIQTYTADLSVRQKDKFDIPRLMAEKFPGDPRIISKPARSPAGRSVPVFSRKRALLKAQDGCNFNCSYCIVPAARGEPVSRRIVEIVDEAKAFADAGHREIIITGANLGCYSDGGKKLVHLVQEIEKIEQIARIRLSSIEVSTVEREIIDWMASSEKLCRSIHVPLQSGDDRILKAMGRRYTSAEYRRFAEYAFGKIPLLGLGTDIIVGFPDEDESAFQNSVSLVRDLPFSNLHVFSYSKRAGTPAADMAQQVKISDKKKRSSALQELGEQKKAAFGNRFVGQKISVLIEKLTANSRGTGWTGEYVKANVPLPTHFSAGSIIYFIPSCYDSGHLG